MADAANHAQRDVDAGPVERRGQAAVRDEDVVACPDDEREVGVQRGQPRSDGGDLVDGREAPHERRVATDEARVLAEVAAEARRDAEEIGPQEERVDGAVGARRVAGDPACRQASAAFGSARRSCARRRVSGT